MHYLAFPDSMQKRKDPTLLFSHCKSIISLAMPYTHPDHLPSIIPGEGRIAAYAFHMDYHRMAKSAAGALIEWMSAELKTGFRSLITVDNKPILERDMAARAGLGWIGKNGCFISASFGSFLFLVEILVDVPLQNMHDDAPRDRCGNCRRCVTACPTGCISGDRTIDARRCIAYLTIEHKSVIPLDLRQLMGQWIFGCDICQMACPWNAKVHAPSFLELSDYAKPRPFPILEKELSLTETEFNNKFIGTSIHRTGRSRYLRNVAVALGNTKDHLALPALEACILQEEDDLIKSHAIWALGQINHIRARKFLEPLVSKQASTSVKNEMQRILNKETRS
jgi:epoxyqueuosine reductase